MNVERSTARGAAHYPGNPAPAPARRAPAPCSCWLTALLAGVRRRRCRAQPRRARASAMPRSWPVVEPGRSGARQRGADARHQPGRHALPLWRQHARDGGFDCSGLVNYVYRDMLDLQPAAHLARPGRARRARGSRRERLAAADLVFFGSGGTVSHVGIYVGEGRFVHAPSSGGTVRLDHLDGPYWRDHYSRRQARPEVAAFRKSSGRGTRMNTRTVTNLACVHAALTIFEPSPGFQPVRSPGPIQ